MPAATARGRARCHHRTACSCCPCCGRRSPAPQPAERRPRRHRILADLGAAGGFVEPRVTSPVWQAVVEIYKSLHQELPLVPASRPVAPLSRPFPEVTVPSGRGCRRTDRRPASTLLQVVSVVPAASQPTIGEDRPMIQRTEPHAAVVREDQPALGVLIGEVDAVGLHRDVVGQH